MDPFNEQNKKEFSKTKLIAILFILVGIILIAIPSVSKFTSDSKETNNGTEDDGGTPINDYVGVVCKAVTNTDDLHKVTCSSGNHGCKATIGYGNTITYGTIKDGSPKSGDAYDCKVTESGDYTERFYYVGNSGDNSILIYYKNINGQTNYSYDESNENNHGPRDGYKYLPSTKEWNNPGLIAPSTIDRGIVTETGSIEPGGKLRQSFKYPEKAARFLTTQELVNACSTISAVGELALGELDGCNWLLESIGIYESTDEHYGYWLETPRTETDYDVFVVMGYNRIVSRHSVYSPSYGIRPVITVKTSNLE